MSMIKFLSEREVDYMFAREESTAVTTAFITNIAEPVCVAMRGRMYRGEPQHYEARDDGKTNVLTRVEKDNYIAEAVDCER